MNNMKKLGLTALAGSLVASSAYAGALDVSGSAKMTYFGNDDDEVTGNSFKMAKGITFSGSGELDNGFSVGYSYTMTNAAFSSQTVTLDMGDTGTVGISNSGAVAGMMAYASVVPNSGEQAWDDMNQNDNGITTFNNLSETNSVFYKNSFGDVGVNLAYTDDTGGSDQHGVLTYSGMEGVTVGIGGGEEGAHMDMETFFVKYTMGNVTAAYQRTNLDFTAAGTNDNESDSIGIGKTGKSSAQLKKSMILNDKQIKKLAEENGMITPYTVSYTHLTLPTNREV